MNDTVGPEGLFPSLLVFGVLPRLSYISPRDLPVHEQRLRAMVAARNEHERIVSRSKINPGLRRTPPAAAGYTVQPGDPFMYTERGYVTTLVHMWLLMWTVNVYVYKLETTLVLGHLI